MIEQARTDPSLQSIFQQTLTPRHPSQLYEALLEGAFLFGCLWFLRIRTRQPRGMLAGFSCCSTPWLGSSWKIFASRTRR